MMRINRELIFISCILKVPEIIHEELINGIYYNNPLSAIHLTKEPDLQKGFFRKGLTICAFRTTAGAESNNK